MDSNHPMVPSGSVPKIIVITGVMAAGKSTTAALLAERLPRSVHVRGDLFRRMIVNGRAEIRSHLTDEDRRQLRLRHRLTALTADGYAEAGFTVVIQDVIAGDFLTEFVGMVQHRPLAVVALVPDTDAIKRREAHRGKKGYVGGWTVEDLDASFRTTTPHLGLWLDSSHQSPEETVDEIWRRLSEAIV